MKPRLAALLFILLLSPQFEVSAAQPPWRVTVLKSMTVPVIVESSVAFQAHLKRLVTHQAPDGPAPRDLEVTVLHAEGSRDLGEQRLRRQLQLARPDLVVSIATIATQASHKVLQGTGIPGIFFIVTDPAGAGVVASNSGPPDGDMTGLVYGIDRSTKLDLAFRALGALASDRKIRIGLIHTDYPSSMGDRRMLATAVARHPNFELISRSIVYQPVPDRLDELLVQVRTAVAELEDQVDYWWAPIGPFGERDEYSRLLIEASRHPLLVGSTLSSVATGALLFIGPDIRAQAEEAAEMAYRLLSGVAPGRIEVAYPRRYRLAINLDTAHRIGAILPADLLELARNDLYVNGRAKTNGLSRRTERADAAPQ